MESNIRICIYILYIYVYICHMAATLGIWYMISGVICLGNLLILHKHLMWRPNMASDQRGSPNRSQSLSQTRKKKNKSIQTKLTLLDDLSIPLCHPKKFVTNPPRVEVRHCWPSPATTCKGHNFVQSTMKHQNLQLAGFCSGVFCLWCFFKLKTVFPIPIHFVTQLWFATRSSDMMDYIYTI